MLVGESHTFRAVGKDGRMRHNVRWSLSPDQAATLTLNGDEATVQAKEASNVFLTASADGDSAEATIEIQSGSGMASGTVLWTVPPIPGCKGMKITQAVPSANGPDLYVQEECENGTLIRALTADGREMWRRQLGGSDTTFRVEPGAKTVPSQGGHFNLKVPSVCDAVTSGMSKEEVSRLMNSRNLHLEEKRRQRDSWEVEEEGSRCSISFDGKTGTVITKKKTIVAD